MKQIAIDGTCSSGKGTVANIIADRCNLLYVDTGVTYRCVALAIVENKIDINDEEKIIEIAKDLKIEFTKERKTFLNGKDVSNEIRSKEVNDIVYKVSRINEIRKLMVKFQQDLAKDKDVIMEGRDITTIVLPNANYKFYLNASLDERARRRFEQNKELGIDTPLEEIKKNLKIRDHSDKHKEFGALKRTNEQIYINTTNLTIEEVVEKILKIIGE